MFDYELLLSDSDLEIEAAEELKPQKIYDVIIGVMNKCCIMSENSTPILFLCNILCVSRCHTTGVGDRF